jgi:hypothetical protein
MYSPITPREYGPVVENGYKLAVSQIALETTLKTLDRAGTLVKDRGYRQVWRFEHAGKPYYLKFYPRIGSRFNLKRLFRGNPAMREFTRLQWLQKAALPAARAVAVLVGFNLAGQLGDAVILEAIEPSIPLDCYLNDLLLRGERTPYHRELSRQVRELVHALGAAKLGHSDLHLGNFLLTGQDCGQPKLHILDAYAVRPGGMKMQDLQLLGHGVQRFATHTDILRAWHLLQLPGVPPRDNPVTRRQWRKFLRRTTKENRYFGGIYRDAGKGWAGVFFKHAPVPRRWARASAFDVEHRDWQTAWPDLLARMEADQLDIIKRTRSGDVLSAEISLGGRPMSVIIKRPRRKFWWRYVTEIGRGARPRRAWKKAWQLIVRDIPTAWPLLMMERRVLGYVVDSVVVFERVRGELLGLLDLDALDFDQRQHLFARLGRTMRGLESSGLTQYDAKSINWMVVMDDKEGPVPVIIDVDGIRRHFGASDGIERLLRSMKDHPQYTPADSLALCRGYAPRAHVLAPRDEAGSAEAAESRT